MIPVSLSKSVQAHDEDITTLELQEPTFEQIQKFGVPISTDSSGNFTVNAQVALKYIPELAGVPLSTIKTLSAYDLNNLCWAVWRFFMTPQETLTPSS